MATWLVLEDWNGNVPGIGGNPSIGIVISGSLLDDTQYNVAAAQAVGLPAILYNPLTMAAPRTAYQASRQAPQQVNTDANLLALLIAAGAISGGTILVNNTAFVDPVNGNDATAVLNDAGKPYQTVAAAIAAAPNNSVIRLAPGTYAEPSFVIPPTKGFVFQGSGVESTNLLGATAGVSWEPGVNGLALTLNDLSITAVLGSALSVNALEADRDQRVITDGVVTSQPTAIFKGTALIQNSVLGNTALNEGDHTLDNCIVNGDLTARQDANKVITNAATARVNLLGTLVNGSLVLQSSIHVFADSASRIVGTFDPGIPAIVGIRNDAGTPMVLITAGNPANPARAPNVVLLCEQGSPEASATVNVAVDFQTVPLPEQTVPNGANSLQIYQIWLKLINPVNSALIFQVDGGGVDGVTVNLDGLTSPTDPASLAVQNGGPAPGGADALVVSIRGPSGAARSTVLGGVGAIARSPITYRNQAVAAAGTNVAISPPLPSDQYVVSATPTLVATGPVAVTAKTSGAQFTIRSAVDGAADVVVTMEGAQDGGP